MLFGNVPRAYSCQIFLRHKPSEKVKLIVSEEQFNQRRIYDPYHFNMLKLDVSKLHSEDQSVEGNYNYELVLVLQYQSD